MATNNKKTVKGKTSKSKTAKRSTVKKAKSTAKAKTSKMPAKRKPSKTSRINCRPSFKISEAGHLLVVKHDSEAGRVLATAAKNAKAKRKARGCLNGTPKQGTSFRLSDKQIANLPKPLQKAILAYHRSK